MRGSLCYPARTLGLGQSSSVDFQILAQVGRNNGNARVNVHTFFGRQRVGRDFLFAHAPLQGLAKMKSISERIKRSEGKRICTCWWIALVLYVYTHVSASVCVCVCVCVCVYMCMYVCVHKRAYRPACVPISQCAHKLLRQNGDLQSTASSNFPYLFSTRNSNELSAHPLGECPFLKMDITRNRSTPARRAEAC